MDPFCPQSAGSSLHRAVAGHPAEFWIRSGLAAVFYEELPWLYHAGMGCLVWAWFAEMLRDGGGQRVGGWISAPGLRVV